MTKEKLQKLYDRKRKITSALSIIKTEIKKVEWEYMNEIGLKQGQKVKTKSGYDCGAIGIVVERRIGHHEKFKIEYHLAKITKSGKAHKTAKVGWWVAAEELEIIEEKEVIK